MSDIQIGLASNESFRHWSSRSQSFASVDVLQQYLREGWVAFSSVTVETFYVSPSRTVHVYRFTLHRKGEEIDLPVIHSPLVQRLISEYNLNLVYAMPIAGR